MWSTIATWNFSLQAVEKAGEILQSGGTAVDAAEQGIRLVESDPEIDSVGRGGWLNADGELELDAAMMNGDTLRIGAVAAVQGFEHPVTIARAVMEHCRHNILVGSGAAEFARAQNIPEASAERMILPAARELYRKKRLQASEDTVGHDTIGLIARDRNGTIVSAVSTSGASMKLPGRVGDSPIVGSGFYACSSAGAAVATGMGEDIMRTCCSYRAVACMAEGMSPEEAARRVILTGTQAIKERGFSCDCMAVVCMNAEGKVGAASNHQGFAYTCRDENGIARLIEVDPIIDIGGRPNETKSQS